MTKTKVRGARFLDVSGQQFGRLTAIKPEDKKTDSRYRWLCQCSCGAKCFVRISSLRNGTTQSCGCLSMELCIERATIHGCASMKRGRTTEYNSWRAVMERCFATTSEQYQAYGAVGITCCARWKRGEGSKSGFECFLADMGLKPTRGHTIDRFPNLGGNYEPSNCRWATKTEQSRGRRSNIIVTHKGKTMCVMDWSTEVGMCYRKLLSRLHRGWDFERAIQCKINPRIRSFTVDGETKNLKDWAKHHGIAYHALYRKVVQQGMSLAAAISASK